MSNIENFENSGEENIEKAEIVQPQIPKNKVQAMFQELEIMTTQKLVIR